MIVPFQLTAKHHPSGQKRHRCKKYGFADD
jgi:hypothetical protein